MKRRTPNPLIPGKATDRTGTGGILRKAIAAIRVRYAGLEADVLLAFDRIPVYTLNLGDDEPKVRYGLTPEQLASVSDELQAALDRWLTSGRERNHVLWWDPFVEQAHQLGAAQSVANLSRLSESYAAVRSLQTVVFSEQFRLRVAMSRYRAYEHWTGLAAATRQDLAGVIGRAVVDGLNPKAAGKLIAERIGVSRARAEGYAQTDITGTLREARWAEKDDTEESLGIRTGLLWTSAFLPTTRATHAARHGHAYTTAEVKDFYGRDGNRYRCHCAQTEVLLDDNGKPIVTAHLKQAMAGELAKWRRAKK
jgi:Phage Mu protein F like protein